MPTVHEDVDNIRVTYVPADERSADANWAGFDVIRVQAYRQDPSISQSLHRGAEFPISDSAALCRLMETICRVYREGQPQTAAARVPA